MTVLIQSIRNHGPSLSLPAWDPAHKRYVAVALLASLVMLMPNGTAAALTALSEAYLAVTVFVAGTLALVFAAERAFKTDLGLWLQQYRRWQVPVAALLGAFPGCGGAIIAITQFSRGYLSFGAVVATLTATMGDAMFLLLAREPQTAVLVLGVSLVVGVLSGYALDAIHGPGFMRPKQPPAAVAAEMATAPGNSSLSAVERLWLALIVPGLAIGLLSAFQIDADAWFEQLTGTNPAFWLGAAGALLAVAMWLRKGAEQPATCASGKSGVARAVIQTTNFVTAWVVFAFVTYELLVAAGGFDLARGFAVWGALIPVVAVLIGMVPGCGPQILVTSMYLSGAVPLSAQLANAMANDGDALFPAIASAPKAALMATLYSAIPALIVGYGWYWLME